MTGLRQVRRHRSATALRLGTRRSRSRMVPRPSFPDGLRSLAENTEATERHAAIWLFPITMTKTASPSPVVLCVLDCHQGPVLVHARCSSSRGEACPLRSRHPPHGCARQARRDAAIFSTSSTKATFNATKITSPVIQSAPCNPPSPDNTACVRLKSSQTRPQTARTRSAGTPFSLSPSS